MTCISSRIKGKKHLRYVFNSLRKLRLKFVLSGLVIIFQRNLAFLRKINPLFRLQNCAVLQLVRAGKVLCLPTGEKEIPNLHIIQIQVPELWYWILEVIRIKGDLQVHLGGDPDLRVPLGVDCVKSAVACYLVKNRDTPFISWRSSLCILPMASIPSMLLSTTMLNRMSRFSVWLPIWLSRMLLASEKLCWITCTLSVLLIFRTPRTASIKCLRKSCWKPWRCLLLPPCPWLCILGTSLATGRRRILTRSRFFKNVGLTPLIPFISTVSWDQPAWLKPGWMPIQTLRLAFTKSSGSGKSQGFAPSVLGRAPHSSVGGDRLCCYVAASSP